MPNTLASRRVLVAEDLYLVAMPICEALAQAGWDVIGPYASCADCLSAIDRERLDVAVLDIGLNDGLVFPVAAILDARGVPFVFLTGYTGEIVPEAFAAAPLLFKPLGSEKLCETVAGLVKQHRPA